MGVVKTLLIFARVQADTRATPFDFNPLSMDFPALCLQCLESPPTLFSSTPHSTSKSWSIAPPGDKQNEALRTFFGEEIRQWKIAHPAKAGTESFLYSPPQGGDPENDSRRLADPTEHSVDSLERQVTEHLEASFQVWNSLPAQRRQELWILEMARSIDKRRKEVIGLKESRNSLKQENASLKLQVDHLNRFQQNGDLDSLARTLKVDDKMAEVWNEQSSGSLPEDRRDISTMVSGAIERWRNVIVSSRTSNSIHAQRSLEDMSAPLKTPTSVIHAASPDYSRSAQHQSYHQSGQARFIHQSPPHGLSAIRNTSTSSAGQTATASEPKTSVASTPAQSFDGDGSDEDADADADVEMEGGQQQYLSDANTSAHHTLAQMAQHPTSQQHQMLPISRPLDQHVSAVRHSPYPQRPSPYGSHNLVPSQQMQMTPQAFSHQLQGLENHFAHGHGAMGWNNH